jgi:DNA-binding response OmpR family regulator
MRILLIEDDRILGETIKDYLSREGEIETIWLWDERQLPEALKTFEFDVIVVDLILNFTKGEKIISVLRKEGFTTPILVTTAKIKLEDKERCFLIGADDYLTKPFELKELLLRIKALSRRKHIQSVFKIGDLTINLDAQTIYKEKEEIKISKTAWRLLSLLLKKRGEVVDTDTIMRYIWPDKDVGEEIVRAYIKELRKILPKDSLITYPTRGYRLL